MTNARDLKRGDWVKTASILRAVISKADTAKTKKKIATIKNWFDIKTMALGSYIFLPTVIIDRKVITKLEKG